MTVRLAIVACGPQLEVALESPGQAVASVVRLAGVSPRSTLVLAAVDLLVEDAGLAPTAVERVVVSRGPGSFTGIRSGIATALGLAAATGAIVRAYDSLLVQAARVTPPGEVWAAQPGRRGEVYARRFGLGEGAVPIALAPIEILAVADLGGRGRWIAPDALDLGTAERAVPCRSAAEALLRLDGGGADPQPVEPLYVEGPPIHRAAPE
ncbi:MAG: tRNA (adenosine(37)-N6)-threonylcarbamoyltransferase complex dimerization subunit type 1 TsaB [Thermoanaerobaculales bacterium]|jgi:tRNA threonylcarbamoyl adenosine modification protein YeaZ|nr:tRNA (adenosine(37)-N6)-threonylcarbamoyltransferase complex dimerization subunit type 1 TsaB [Thermoanaerobaculales bacterium]